MEKIACVLDWESVARHQETCLYVVDWQSAATCGAREWVNDDAVGAEMDCVGEEVASGEIAIADASSGYIAAEMLNDTGMLESTCTSTTAFSGKPKSDTLKVKQ